MKYCHIVFVILVGYLLGVTALVHFIKLDKGANGCKTKAKKGEASAGAAKSRMIREAQEMKVGETLKDDNVCGVYVCQNKEGDALIHYCQRPAPFENCNSDGVSTVTPFPECCWQCVRYISCEKNAAPADKPGEDKPGEDKPPEEQPAEEQPAGEPPAEEPPAEEKL